MGWLLLRRVEGNSMQPAYKPGRLVVASGLLKPKVGSVVIAGWRGRDLIKRVGCVDGDNYMLEGDNSSDSLRTIVSQRDIRGVVF